MVPDAVPAKRKDLLKQISDLQTRLDEAEETLRALRNGEIDAIVTSSADGDRVYTLKGADEAYRIMVEEMGEGAITLSVDGLILFSNEHFATMLRRPLERVIGAHLKDLVAVEDVDLVSAMVKSGGRRKAEIRLKTDGASMPVYLSMQNMLLSGTACLCGIVTDLSDQKRYAEIAAVLEAVPVGVFIAQDVECQSILCNRMAYELLRMAPAGTAAKSVLALEKSKPWREVKDGRDIPIEELPLQTAARTGWPVRDYEYDVLFDDGAYRCWLGNAVPLFDETGRPRGAVGTAIDITERRRAAEAIEAANIELRNFGNALTQDLREPLGMVVKFTKLLAKEHHAKLGTDADTFISDSLESALRIEALLDALLEYWTVTESTGLTLSSVDCNQVLSQTRRRLEEAIRKSGTTVTSGNLPTVVGEEHMLERVFGTLIGNAIQYRGEAPPSIHIAAENTYDRWLLTVRDNGIGIDPKNAQHVFGLFKRLHGNEIPGTGIGLALCRKIVERYGGRIWVESAAGKGAAFRFTLPTYLDSARPGFSSP